MSTAAVSNERLTWQQMTERYPDTWVGLTDVVREADGITVESAVVAIAGDKSTVVGAKNDGAVEYALFTTPDRDIFTNWGNWPCSQGSNLADIFNVR